MEVLKLSAARIEDQLTRILQSRQFRDALRLQKFLRFVVSLTIDGKADQIKESTIAAEVFGRADTSDDSIVRSSARRLRARLEEYYSAAGATDPIHIVIPRGSYVPEIMERSLKSQSEPSSAVAPPAKASRKRWWMLLAAMAVLAVAVILALRWRDRERAGSSSSSEARELYLQGRYYWSKRTPEDLNQAVDYFTQAVVRDPRYAQAYVGLADTYNLLSEYTVMPYQEAFKRAIAAANTAIRLDERLPEAHNSLAYASFYGAWDAGTAEREFRRALLLNPSYSTAHHWYATFLMSVGREREALSEIGQAQGLDPSSKAIFADKGLILLWAGQVDAARTLLEQIAASDPQFASPHRYLASVYLLEKRYPDFLAEWKKDAVLTHNSTTLTMAEAGERALVAGGPAAMFEQLMRAQEKSPSIEGARYYWLARMSAFSGNTNQAVRYLNLAFHRHDVNMVTLTVDPFFSSMRTEPAFQELVRRVGVVR